MKIKTLILPDMVAHKLAAVQERREPANRDLFDLHYFLSSPQGVEINYEIVKERTGQDPREFYDELIKYVGKVDGKKILGELRQLLKRARDG